MWYYTETVDIHQSSHRNRSSTDALRHIIHYTLNLLLVSVLAYVRSLDRLLFFIKLSSNILYCFHPWLCDLRILSRLIWLVLHDSYIILCVILWVTPSARRQYCIEPVIDKTRRSSSNHQYYRCSISSNTAYRWTVSKLRILQYYTVLYFLFTVDIIPRNHISIDYQITALHYNTLLSKRSGLLGSNDCQTFLHSNPSSSPRKLSNWIISHFYVAQSTHVFFSHYTVTHYKQCSKQQAISSPNQLQTATNSKQQFLLPHCSSKLHKLHPLLNWSMKHMSQCSNQTTNLRVTHKNIGQ